MPQIIIDLTPAQANRLQDAWPHVFGNSIPATIGGVKTHLTQVLKDVVKAGEIRAAQANIPTPPDFDPS